MPRLPSGTLSLLILALLACPALARTPQPFVPEAPRPAAPSVQAVQPETGQTQANIRFLEARLKTQSARLEDIAGATVSLVRERRSLEADITLLTGRLRAMLPRLWELNVALTGAMEAPAAPWDEADRSLNWLGAVYGEAAEETSRLRHLNSELAANQAKQAEIKLDAEVQAALDRVRDAAESWFTLSESGRDEVRGEWRERDDE